jgi:hypothetical protein
MEELNVRVRALVLRKDDTIAQQRTQLNDLMQQLR